MSKIKYLANNLALFSVSNFVSKILVFLLVPLYTNVLTTREYGIADVFQVTLLLLVPALTVNMGEGALRYGIAQAGKRDLILKIGLKYTFLASALVALIGAAATCFVPETYRFFPLYFAILFATNALYEYLILYFQGCEQVKIVVLGSIASTVMIISCNLVFLLLVKLGLRGYLFSQMIAYAVAAGLMLLLGRSAKKAAGQEDTAGEAPEEASEDTETADKPGDKKRLEKELLSYGAPLILYSTGSWINNASDRYLVLYLLGAAANGVYGVAYKIPAILMVFQRIFAQAWQMSATKSYQDSESEAFFSMMYRAYHTVMVIGCSVLILLVKPVARFLFQKDFYEAWVFVPPLLISVIFGALTGFLGSINLAHKDSKSMGIATFSGAALNVILNVILIPKTGAMGAAIATAVSYFTMYFAALLITRKHVRIRSNFVRDYLAYAVLIVQSVLMINGKGTRLYLYASLAVLLLFFMHIKEIAELYERMKGILKRKKDET
ncbi:MAG: oligosaccharide flippase family protein [Lachnospiraceae bacterium]|nr:oligosaccharide flippase family protein [Lachnospiraceae bacterium]